MSKIPPPPANDQTEQNLGKVKVVTANLWLDKKIHTKLKIEAAKREVDMRVLAEQILSEWFENNAE